MAAEPERHKHIFRDRRSHYRPCHTVAFVASAGRGYLLPMGFVILTLALAQIVAVAGWGAFFPWAVAGLFSSIAGPQGEQVTTMSFALVIVTAVVGLLATFAWWQYADQVV